MIRKEQFETHGLRKKFGFLDKNIQSFYLFLPNTVKTEFKSGKRKTELTSYTNTFYADTPQITIFN